MVADLCHVVLSCFRGEKAKRRHAKTRQMVIFFVFSHGDLSPRHTKVRHFSCVAFSPPVCRIFARQNHHLACFCVATFCPARQRYDKQRRKRERSPSENPPNGDFFVFSHGDLSPRHTKVRDIPCVAFSATVCRIFCLARRKVAMRKPDKITFYQVFAWRPFAFSPRKHVYTTWHKSSTIKIQYKHFARVLLSGLFYFLK